jgi:nucleolar protein 4
MLFRSYGKVKHVTIPKKKPGLLAGFGFVVMRGGRMPRELWMVLMERSLMEGPLRLIGQSKKNLGGFAEGDANSAIDNKHLQNSITNEDGHERGVQRGEP